MSADLPKTMTKLARAGIGALPSPGAKMEIPANIVSSTVPLLLGQPAWPAVPTSADDLHLPPAVINDLIL